ncbi:MAG: hypothetical protein RL238_3337 [Actinomycetota bacterium]|jgi:tight adherence protein B
MMLGLFAALAVVLLGHRARPTPPRHVHHATRRRPSRRSDAPGPEEWAQWLEAVAAHVRGGASLATAVQAAHRHHQLRGADIAPGAPLAAWVEARPGDPHEAVVAQVLTVAVALGGSVAATVQAGAALLRERAAVAAEASAHAAQARLSARVLTAVPLVFAGWNLVAGHGFRQALATPVGALAAVLGVLLSIAGWRWMHHLVDRVAR